MVKKHITLKSKLSEVSKVGSSFAEDASSFGIPEILVAQVELCLAELLTNVVKHAYQGIETGDIELYYEIDHQLVTIKVTDYGIIFDTKKKDDYLLYYDTEDRDRLPEHGMGLFLVEQIMDFTHYERNNNQNTFIIQKKW